jgi:hypothetical protein
MINHEKIVKKLKIAKKLKFLIFTIRKIVPVPGEKAVPVFGYWKSNQNSLFAPTVLNGYNKTVALGTAHGDS